MTVDHLPKLFYFLGAIAFCVGCAEKSSDEKSTQNALDQPIHDGRVILANNRRMSNIDLSEFDMFVTLDVPAGATVEWSNGIDDCVTIKAERFAIQVQKNGEPHITKKDEALRIIREDDNSFIFVEEDIFRSKGSVDTIRFYATITLGEHSYLCSSRGALILGDLKFEEPFTIEEVEFMLNCAKSLARKTVNGKPVEEPAPQAIPPGYPPNDPRKVEIAINEEWVAVGGYRIRPDRTKTTFDEMSKLFGEPETVYENVINHIFIHEEIGIRYYRSKLSKYIDSLVIVLNPEEDSVTFGPKSGYSGQLFIGGTEITAQTSFEELERIGFTKRGSRYEFDHKRFSVYADLTNDETKIHSISVGRRI